MDRVFNSYEIFFLKKIEEALYEAAKTFQYYDPVRKLKISFDLYRYIYLSAGFAKKSEEIFIKKAKFFGIQGDLKLLYVKYILCSEIAAKLDKHINYLSKKDIINAKDIPLKDNEWATGAISNLIPFTGDHMKAVWLKKNGLKYKVYLSGLCFIYTNGEAYYCYNKDYFTIPSIFIDLARPCSSDDLQVIENYDLDYNGYIEKIKKLYIKELKRMYEVHEDGRYLKYLAETQSNLIKIDYSGKENINFYFKSKIKTDELLNNVAKTLLYVMNNLQRSVFLFYSRLLDSCETCIYINGKKYI